MSDVVVRTARSDQWQPALRLVLTPQPDVTAPVTPQELIRQAVAGKVGLDRLLVAQRDTRVVGAIWANLLGGHAASVWAPQLVDGEPESTSGVLLQALERKLIDDGVEMVQSLLSRSDIQRAERLSQCGFRPLAELEYLVCAATDFPDAPPTCSFALAPYDQGCRSRLTKVVELTYVDTMDCPALNGLRRTDDVLDGYERTDASECWQLVRYQGEDVGCLLLADCFDQDHVELVYMGLVPSVRGRGWGRLLVQHVQWFAREQGRSRVVLAVDADNHPALDIYASTGFVSFDRRRGLIKMLGSPSSTP